MLSRQLLRIVSVLVDLCQRADKAGPLVVSWNRSLLGGNKRGMNKTSNTGKLTANASYARR